LVIRILGHQDGIKKRKGPSEEILNIASQSPQRGEGAF